MRGGNGIAGEEGVIVDSGEWRVESGELIVGGVQFNGLIVICLSYGKKYSGRKKLQVCNKDCKAV